MQPNENDRPAAYSRSSAAGWILIGGILVGLAGVGYGVYGHREGARIAESQQAGFRTTISEMQRQMQALQDRLTAQEKVERERVPAPAAPNKPSPPGRILAPACPKPASAASRGRSTF